MEEAINPISDHDTVAAIAAATNEHGTRIRKTTSKPADFVETPDLDAPELTQKTTSKKRAAPTEAKKPPPKKRKSEAPSDRATPASNRASSPTPSLVSVKATKPPATKKSKNAKARPTTPKTSGPAARARSLSPDPEDSEISDPDTLYCICRKPDNHKFMVGCDGGCDDWFHGKCMNIHKGDQALLDKFICPNCQDQGKGVTAWKPMCRRDGCRNPARLKKGSESKYCSKTCGLDFMRSTVKRSSEQLDDERSTPKKKQKSNSGLAKSMGSNPEDMSLGGSMRPSELKSLTEASTDSEHFRQLGSHPFLTPPPSATAEAIPAPPQPIYTEAEKLRLGEIESRKLMLRQQRLLHKDRETFLTMMKARILPLKEALEMKGEALPCGFDPIWALDDVSFQEWRQGTEGRNAFDGGELKVPQDLSEDECSICTRANWARKRCTQHGSWQPLILRDVRFESAEIGREMRKIDAEEKDIAAMALRRAHDKATEDLHAAEGWVEVVGSDDQAADVKHKATLTQHEPPGATPLVEADAPKVKMEDDVRAAYEAPVQDAEDSVMAV